MHRLLRRLAPLTGLLTLALAMPTTAQAAPVSSQTVVNAGITCRGTTTGGQPVFVAVTKSADFGDGVFAAVGPEEDPILRAFSSGGGWTGASPSFTLDVYAGDRLVGTGSLTATTSVRTQTETTTRNSNGNAHVRAHIVAATLDAVVDLRLPGQTVAALACTGEQTTTTYTQNNPASTVRATRFLYDNVDCTGNAVIGLFGPAEGEYFLSVDVLRGGEQFHLFGPVEDPRGTFTVTLPLRDSETGESLGDFPVTVTMTPTGPTTNHLLRTSIARVRQAWTPYAVNARVDLPWGSIDGTCRHLEIAVREMIRPSQGPRPGGTPPANDIAAGAIALTPGTTVRTTTRSAVLGTDAPMPCADAPVGRTLWYSFVGTGGTVRIDTAGSAFDTVIAVYAPGRSRPVACANDVGPGGPLPNTSLQAAVEVPTQRGVTYRVQVGGIFADFGRLVLSAS